MTREYPMAFNELGDEPESERHKHAHGTNAPPDWPKDYPGSGRAPRPQYKVLTIHDFLNRPPNVPLVENLLPASGDVSCLFGESNSYKSFIGIDLMCSVAHNIPFHGLKVDPGPVLFVVTEGAYAAVTKRYRGWLEHHNIPMNQWDRVKIINESTPLNRPEHVLALIETVKNQVTGAKLAVFDLLQGSMEGSDGDGDVANAWVRGTQALSLATGITQLHITHSGYSAPGRGRGHTHLWGSFSTRLKAEGNTVTRTAKLVVERHKDIDSANIEWNFTLEQIPVGDGHETTLVPRLTATSAEAKTTKRGRPRNEKRNATVSHFLTAYDLEAEDGQPSIGFNNAPVVKVHIDKIRDRMKTRGWLEKDDKGHISDNGRKIFRNARDDAEADGKITEENDLVWRI
jgi:hypothetical protein